MSVPVPVFVSEPAAPPAAPPSWITPEKMVERLLPPIARFFEPRKTLPTPSIEPAVVQPVTSAEISRAPLPFRVKRAVPPLALSAIKVLPPLLAMIVAPPAVLLLKKIKSLVVVMVALPAVLLALKFRTQSLVMWALPAVLVLSKNRSPVLAMVALPALVALKKAVVPLLMIEVIPVVSALTMLNTALLTTAPTILPVLLASPSCKMPPEIVVPPV